MDLQRFGSKITVPYTIILPAFVGRRRRRRSLQRHLPDMEEEDEDYRSYFDSVASAFDVSTKEGVVYARLYSLFSWMGLEEPECHKRLLCLLSQDPFKYSPLSDIVFQHLDPRRDFVHVIHNDAFSTYSNQGPNRLYFDFYEAERKGFFPGTNCTHETIRCKVNPDDVINWDVMKAVRAIKELVNIQFK